MTKNTPILLPKDYSLSSIATEIGVSNPHNYMASSYSPKMTRIDRSHIYLPHFVLNFGVKAKNHLLFSGTF